MENNPKKSFKILLLGCTGSGKSNFGNFLLNQDNAERFKDDDSSESVTRELKTIKGYFNEKLISKVNFDRPIEITDTPGFFSLDEEFNLKNLKIIYDKLEDEYDLVFFFRSMIRSDNSLFDVLELKILKNIFEFGYFTLEEMKIFLVLTFYDKVKIDENSFNNDIFKEILEKKYSNFKNKIISCYRFYYAYGKYMDEVMIKSWKLAFENIFFKNINLKLYKKKNIDFESVFISFGELYKQIYSKYF